METILVYFALTIVNAFLFGFNLCSWFTDKRSKLTVIATITGAAVVLACGTAVVLLVASL